MIEGILTGLFTVLQPTNLMMVFVGCFAGTFIGMLPGLGSDLGDRADDPDHLRLRSGGGLILMAGVYYGAIFGGSTSSILINAPGVAGTVATAFDGYPWRGRAMPARRSRSPPTRRSPAARSGRSSCWSRRRRSPPCQPRLPVARLFRAHGARPDRGLGLRRAGPVPEGDHDDRRGPDAGDGRPGRRLRHRSLHLRHDRSLGRHQLPAAGDGDLRAVRGFDGGAQARGRLGFGTRRGARKNGLAQARPGPRSRKCRLSSAGPRSSAS